MSFRDRSSSSSSEGGGQVLTPFAVTAITALNSNVGFIGFAEILRDITNSLWPITGGNASPPSGVFAADDGILTHVAIQWPDLVNVFAAIDVETYIFITDATGTNTYTLTDITTIPAGNSGSTQYSPDLSTGTIVGIDLISAPNNVVTTAGGLYFVSVIVVLQYD